MKALLADILFYLLKKLGYAIQGEIREIKDIKDEGARATEAAKKAVSDLQTPVGQSSPNPDEVPSVEKASEYLKHRRDRKRP